MNQKQKQVAFSEYVKHRHTPYPVSKLQIDLGLTFQEVLMLADRGDYPTYTIDGVWYLSTFTCMGGDL